MLKPVFLYSRHTIKAQRSGDLQTNEVPSLCLSHRGHEAVVQGLIREQNSVFDEDGTGPENEGGKEIDVYVVPGTVELPGINIVMP